MTLTYRTSGAWGGGLGSDLSAAQVDTNFWLLWSQLQTVAGAVSTAVSIASIAVSGNQMTITMTDTTTRGPFTLPVARFNFRGTWQPTTAYAVNDVVTYNGSVYLVIIAHTSGTSFVVIPNYALLLTAPASALPTAGTAGQVLTKNSSTDFDTSWISPDYEPMSINTQTTTAWTLSVTQENAYVRCNNAANITVTIPVDPTSGDWFGAGDEVVFRQINTGAVTLLAASGVVINNPTSETLTTANQGELLFLKYLGSSVWDFWKVPVNTLANAPDVAITSPTNGQILQYSTSSSKWINAAAPSGTLAGLTDVNVTEGSGINGYALVWNNSTSKWIAQAFPTDTLAGLNDVNVTEGAGIDGYSLTWHNATSKWVATNITGGGSITLAGLTDVNVTEGSGIDQYGLYWDNTSSKWIAKVAFVTTGTYPIIVSLSGTTVASEKITIIPDRSITLPISLSGSYFKAGTAATASTVFTLNKNGTSIGTVTFAASATSGTVSFTSAIAFAAGDILTIVAPVTPDTTLADIGMNIKATF